MHVVFDGSVVRPPFSGVHLSVRAELAATAPLMEKATILALDEALGRAVRTHPHCVLRPPPSWTRSVAGRILWQQFSLSRICHSLGADVLHAPAYTAPLFSSTPCVLNVHDIIALEHPRLCAPMNVAHMRLFLPRSARRAAACIVSTNHVAERLCAVVGIPRERVHVVPLGVDAARFQRESAIPGEVGVTPGRYLLFTGNLEPKKGLDTLLDAYPRIARCTSLELVLAGRAAWRSHRLRRRIATYDGPGRIHALGRVPGAQLPALYQHAFAFAFPSVCEGFGMPVLEAMAAGCPVVHSDHPAVLEAAGGAGVSFPVGDADALARAVCALHDSPTGREELAESGRQQAMEHTWGRWAIHAAEILRANSR